MGEIMDTYSEKREGLPLSFARTSAPSWTANQKSEWAPLQTGSAASSKCLIDQKSPTTSDKHKQCAATTSRATDDQHHVVRYYKGGFSPVFMTGDLVDNKNVLPGLAYCGVHDFAHFARSLLIFQPRGEKKTKNKTFVRILSIKRCEKNVMRGTKRFFFFNQEKKKLFVWNQYDTDTTQDYSMSLTG